MMDPMLAANDGGLDFLDRVQAPGGEFPSFATPLGDELDWQPDSSVFVTSLCVLALGSVRSDRVGPMVGRALQLVRTEAAPGPLWRFWTHDHDRHLEIPCDADDTACASMALATESWPVDRTRRMLLANRDHSGRFHTWFIPRGPSSLRPLTLRTTLSEARARRRRATFWEMTEATPDDVDGVVNANVLRLFGPGAPAQAVEYVSQIVADGNEVESDSWHRNEFSCWYSVADGLERGVPYSERTAASISDRLRTRLGRDGVDLPPLDLAHGLSALNILDGPEETRRHIADRLLAAQNSDGSWDRSIFFYGGPKMVFGWGSEALSTAAALAALAGVGAG